MHNQAEADLSTLIESTDELIWSVDLDNRLVTYNRALQQAIEFDLGKQVEVGKLPAEILPPHRAQFLPAFYSRAVAEGPFRTEYSLVDGRTLELSFNPILVNGKATGVSVFGKDMTERKAAEESSRLLASIVESSLYAIASMDLEGTILSWNRQSELMYGYTGQEAIGENIRTLVPPRERARLDEVFATIGAGGTAAPIETVSQRKDASLVDVSILISPIRNRNAEVVGFSAIVRDIGERERAADALRASEESLRESQAIADIGSYVLDLRTGLWSGTEALNAVMGIGENHHRTIAGWEALVHPEDRATMAAYFAEEVVGKRQPFDKEYRIVRPSNQTVRWVHGIGRLEFDSQGHPVRMRGVIQDITERKRAEMRLRASEERYRATFDQAAVGFLHTSLDGEFLRCNARFAEIVGYPKEEVPGMTYEQVTWGGDRDQTDAIVQRLASGMIQSTSWEKCCVRKGGSLTWVRLTASPQFDEEGRILHLITIVEDINPRKAAAQRAQLASEARYRIAFQTSLDAVSISRLSDGMHLEANQSLLGMLGFEREEVIGRSSQELKIWVDPAERMKLAEILTRDGECRGLEVQLRKKSGAVLWAQISASPFEIDSVPCVLSVLRDITSARAAADEIKSLAFYDPLTQLPNRRLLVERMRQALAASLRSGLHGAMLFIDLDNFKTLNDTLGHATGDMLLKEVARRLTGCMREADTVARLGGDEFVVILENLSGTAEAAAADAKAIAEMILAVVQQPCVLAGRPCADTCSIGITLFGDRLDSVDDILQHADIAMYQAKSAGRNTVRFFAPALQTAVNARAAMEYDLSRAIEQNQFQLYYQPQVERGRLIGAEALVRWRHPQRGMVQPDEFISLAEETGQILALGAWALETACKQIAGWRNRAQTAHIVVAVNISAREFRQPDFAERVMSVLDRTGADPKRLRLELTESVQLESIEDVVDKMAQLRAAGVSFALDDFGTGYSSLCYLKRLPLDQLKIDPGFVRDMQLDATSGAIAKAVIALSEAIGLSVTAEGVETEAQREFLARLGCCSFQGDLCSKPLAPEEFETWLAGFAEEAKQTCA